ncbi:hypothetical protein MHU86_5463 [Fragilaria crotonensis]|nr:hypothetical protein MHU86_5463 [Fragilaria crotonensis]
MISTRLQLHDTNKVKLSFVSSSDPQVFYLFVGRKAQVEWILSEKPFVARRECDPVLVSPAKASTVTLAKDSPVDVLIFEGKPPKSDDLVWEAIEVRRIAWIDDTGRGRFRWDNKVGWRIHRRSISHAAIGGVTDGIFSVFLASRVEEDVGWCIPATGVRATLSRVVDPTKGGRAVDPPVATTGSVEARNTARGLLEWKKRFDKVCVPTVYSKDKWAVRKLSDTELVDVLDLPGTMRKRMNSGQLAQLSKLKVPGKVMAAVVESLVTLVTDGRKRDDLTLAVKNLSRKRPMEEAQGASKKTRHLEGDSHFEQAKMTKGNGESETTISIARVENAEATAPVELSTVVDKAVKSDDAPAPVHLFDRRVLEAFPFVIDRERNKCGGKLGWVEALELLRSFCLHIWKRKVRREFVEWLTSRKSTTIDLISMEKLGWDACRRVDGASFWEWDCGSTPLFWRWPEVFQRDIWQGAAPRFVGAPPTSKEAQPAYEDMKVRAKVSAKLQKVVDRGYIEIVEDAEKVKSFMFMFDVPKGDSDIRMVYDGSRSGFNESIWAPWFALPTVDTMTRTVLTGGWCGDRDFGEMFLNFMLHPEARVYCGVDLAQLDLTVRGPAASKATLIGCWTRNAMGLRSSPYLSVQSVTRIKQAFLGNPSDRENPFHWETVGLNLPGSEGYDPSVPWISKLRYDRTIAVDLHIYIDDVRITGQSKELVWRAGSRVAKLCSYYGLQDAPRKLREPSQTPGAWAGSVVATDGGCVTKFVTDERWGKTQRSIRWIASKLGIAGDDWSVGLPADEDEGRIPQGKIPHKQAERIRGFLIYVSRTYTAMVPYLKGLHLTLDFWRGGRDNEGWKIIGREEEGNGNKMRCCRVIERLRVSCRLHQG